MTFLTIAGGVVVALLLLEAFLALLDWLHQPKHPFDAKALPRYVQDVLHKGYDGWLMFVKRRSGAEFFRYRKYIRGPGRPGIELAFPDAPWTSDYIEPLKRLLEERGVRYVVTPTGAASGNDSVRVDFGKDVRRAADVGLAIVSDVFGMDHSEFHCYFKGRHDPRTSARIGF
jgi:hypothetical protein